ncbi:hypothetical protein C1H46_009196 [Malus baccata]|uniref:Uncharacterized protein n=1 Tax=Malus baccata TaxID=106549 RepID=A0A540N2D0_MALBA|nr:hypothetical protein C1H46_009196 [Malus baccata]
MVHTDDYNPNRIQLKVASCQPANTSSNETRHLQNNQVWEHSKESTNAHQKSPNTPHKATHTEIGKPNKPPFHNFPLQS